MLTLDLDDPDMPRITVVADSLPGGDGNVDLWAHLRDGRTFAFTAFTVADVQRLMGDDRSFVSPGMLLVAELSEAAILDAVVNAAQLGIEHFGVLQRA